MRNGKLVLAVVALVLLALAPLAEAATEPPSVRLRATTGSKQLEPWSYTWTTPIQTAEGPGCSTIVADGRPNYEKGVRTRFSRSRPMVIVGNSHRPRVLQFRAYARLDRNGFPKGDGDGVRRDLVPLYNDFGEIAAWSIRFRVDSDEAPYFDLHLGFLRPQGCAESRTEGGDAYYAFSVRPRA